MISYTPVMLLSSERSGTNLLRALVSSHPAVASPPPCSIVDVMAGYHFQYFPPNKPPYLEELLEDAIALTKSHLNPWEVTLTPQMVVKKMQQMSFWDLFRALNEVYAGQYGLTCWLSKEPGLFRHIYEVHKHMPNAKYIYMVRDGRDVAASMLKGGVHEFHVFYAAQRWANDQRLCLCALADPLLRDRIHLIKYEDLIEKPESEMRRLMEFIGLGFEASQLEYYKRKNIVQHSEKSRFWKNLAKPIDSTNKGRYRNSLGARNISIFEGVAWQEMQMLGYPLDNTDRKNFTYFDRAQYWLTAAVRRLSHRMDGDKEAARIRDRTKLFRNIRNRQFPADRVDSDTISPGQ